MDGRLDSEENFEKLRTFKISKRTLKRKHWKLNYLKFSEEKRMAALGFMYLGAVSWWGGGCGDVDSWVEMCSARQRKLLAPAFEVIARYYT